MNKLLFICLTLAFGVSVGYSQSLSQVVMANSGMTLTGASNTLSFTLGEPVIGNIDNGDSLGQGFWLGAIESVVLGSEDFNFSESTTIYPNPVQDLLTISFRDMSGESFQLQLYDVTGKLLINREMGGQVSDTLNLSPYTSGIYLLNVTQLRTSTTKTFKIIKN